MKVLLVTDVDGKPVSIHRNRASLMQAFEERNGVIEPVINLPTINISNAIMSTAPISVIWEEVMMGETEKKFVEDFKGTVTVRKVL